MKIFLIQKEDTKCPECGTAVFAVAKDIPELICPKCDPLIRDIITKWIEGEFEIGRVRGSE